MKRPRSSRQRYKSFVEDYRHHRLDLEQVLTQPPAGHSKELRRHRRTYLKKYLRWLWPLRYGIAALFVLALVATGLQMAEPLSLRFIVDRVLLNPHIGSASRFRYLNGAAALFFGLVIASNLVNPFREYHEHLVNDRFTLALRRALFDRLLHLPLPKLWDMKTGGVLSRITGDVDTTTGLLQMALISPAVALIQLIIATCILSALNWRLAAIALVVIPIDVVISFTFAKSVRPIYRSIRKDLEDIDGRVCETFSGIRVVRAFRSEVSELLEYMRGRNTVLRKERFALRRETIIRISQNLLLGLIKVAIVWVGGYLNLRGGATIGDILVFQWYAVMLFAPVWNIVNALSGLQRSLAAIERVFDILAMPSDKPDRPDAREAPRVVSQIRFEDIEFEYREGHPVVCDFNLTVAGGSVIALVGRSGAGKTTVTDLVARFHDPSKGRILLNNVDIRDYRISSYRGLLALVQQDVFLFDGSVRDNIVYGRHKATDAEVQNASRLAFAHEFIDRLPERYATFIGERGVKLSGGQQQRLAIARAILAAPQILILDEATSNLDTESEQFIQASMATLLEGRTTFVIAHRLSTVRRADLILLMEGGRIVERGTHEELMARRGSYHHMVRRQMELQG